MDLIRCDACGFGIKHEHGRNGSGELFTFGLKYPDMTEELDIYARDRQSARALAIAVATAAYDEGWEIVDLPAGGSGGLVQVFSL